MIKYGPRPNMPSALQSTEVNAFKEVIAKKIKSGQKIESKEFKPFWQNDTLKKELYKLQKNKCCYCERKRELRELDVEHYRPKAQVTDEPTHKGYWWLAYNWYNYLLACSPCNGSFKRNHFPLLPGGIRAYKPKDSLKKEKPILINPIDENPKQCIGYDWTGTVGNKTLVKAVGLDDDGRGAGTIKLTKLNRPILAEDRGDDFLTLDALATGLKIALDKGANAKVRLLAKDIKEKTKANKEYAGFRRYFFKMHRIAEYISND